MKVQLLQEFITDRERSIRNITNFLKKRKYYHADFYAKFVPKTEESKKKESEQELLAREIERLYQEAATEPDETKQFEYVMRLSDLNRQYHKLNF